MVMSLLTIPYAAPHVPESELPIPVKRLFLEMPVRSTTFFFCILFTPF